MDNDKEVKKLRKQRGAKGESLKRRINEIEQLINNNGSRTKVKALLGFLLVVKKETETLDTKLSDVDEEHDASWIEVERERCDKAEASVADYLAARVEDPPSTADLTDSWVKMHAPGMSSGGSVDLNEETNSVNKRETDVSYNPRFDGYASSSYHRFPMRPPNLEHHSSMSARAFCFEPQFTPPQHQQKVRFDNTSFIAPSGGSDRNGCNSPSHGHSSNKNDVDTWIDQLDPQKPKKAAIPTDDDVNSIKMMGFFVQQSLPRMEIPEFDGSPATYIEFITKIRDLVHNQPFLTDIQRSTQLLQRLKGEAKQAVRAYSQDWAGYVRSLQRIKFLFGQRSQIARAVLTSITKGNAIPDDDPGALSQFYYDVSDCLTTLEQLNYASDLYSSDTLLQAVKRLPRRLVNKWADYGLSLRQRSQEPSLLYFENWLQARVLAQREACVTEFVSAKSSRKHVNTTHGDGDHVKSKRGGDEFVFWKADWFKTLDPKKKFEKVSKGKNCFNCLKKGHVSDKCTSRGTCLKQGCGQRHHTVLHEYFTSQKNTNNDEKNEEIDVTGDGAGAPNQPPAIAAPAAATGAEFNGMVRGTGKVYLQVVPVVLRANNRRFRTYALLDGGSQFTLIRDTVIKLLRLHGEKGHIEYETVKEKEPSQDDRIPSEKVSLTVSSMNNKNTFLIECAYAVGSTHFNMPAQPSPMKEITGETPSYIEDLDLKAVTPSQISILIGADVAEATLVKEVRRGQPGQPLAVNTMLGWTLYGSSATVSERSDGNKHIHMAHQPSHYMRDSSLLPQGGSSRLMLLIMLLVTITSLPLLPNYETRLSTTISITHSRSFGFRNSRYLLHPKRMRCLRTMPKRSINWNLAHVWCEIGMRFRCCGRGAKCSFQTTIHKQGEGSIIW